MPYCKHKDRDIEREQNMSKSKKLSHTIPDMAYDFTIDVEGSLTKKQYAGDFKCRIPTLKMRAQAELKNAELNRGLEKDIDPSIAQCHYMVSYLRITLTEAPEWWRKSDHGYELYDSNIVSAVYSVVMEFEEKWMKTVWGDEQNK